jgi:hypothetical protein
MSNPSSIELTTFSAGKIKNTAPTGMSSIPFELAAALASGNCKVLSPAEGQKLVASLGFNPIPVSSSPAFVEPPLVEIKMTTQNGASHLTSVPVIDQAPPAPSAPERTWGQFFTSINPFAINEKLVAAAKDAEAIFMNLSLQIASRKIAEAKAHADRLKAEHDQLKAGGLMYTAPAMFKASCASAYAIMAYPMSTPYSKWSFEQLRKAGRDAYVDSIQQSAFDHAVSIADAFYEYDKANAEYDTLVAQRAILEKASELSDPPLASNYTPADSCI